MGQVQSFDKDKKGCADPSLANPPQAPTKGFVWKLTKDYPDCIWSQVPAPPPHDPSKGGIDFGQNIPPPNEQGKGDSGTETGNGSGLTGGGALTYADQKNVDSRLGQCFGNLTWKYTLTYSPAGTQDFSCPAADPKDVSGNRAGVTGWQFAFLDRDRHPIPLAVPAGKKLTGCTANLYCDKPAAGPFGPLNCMPK